MPMCRIISSVVKSGRLLWPVHSLVKTLLAFALLHSVLQGQICLLLQVISLLPTFHGPNISVGPNTGYSPWGHKESNMTNSLIWPWSTERSRTKADRLLPIKHTGHSKHPLPTTQEKTLHVDIRRWSMPKIRLTIFFAAKDGEALYSQQMQDQEPTVATIMNSLLPNSDLNWRM